MNLEATSRAGLMSDLDAGWFEDDFVTSEGGRDHNEDCVGARSAEGIRCWVIADGLGGLEGGRIASHLAVDTVLEAFCNHPVVTPSAVRSYIERAHIEIVSKQRIDPKFSEMQSTIVVLVSDGRRAVWGHVGDSRLYHLRGGTIVSQTLDHSFTQAKVEQGQIAAEDIRSDPDRNLLLQSAGKDGFRGPTVVPKSGGKPLELCCGDAFLLCVDGFWGLIDENEIEIDWAKSDKASDWLRLMRRRVDSKLTSGADNYTAYAVRITTPGLPAPPAAVQRTVWTPPRPRKEPEPVVPPVRVEPEIIVTPVQVPTAEKVPAAEKVPEVPAVVLEPPPTPDPQVTVTSRTPDAVEVPATTPAPDAESPPKGLDQLTYAPPPNDERPTRQLVARRHRWKFDGFVSQLPRDWRKWRLWAGIVAVCAVLGLGSLWWKFGSAPVSTCSVGPPHEDSLTLAEAKELGLNPAEGKKSDANSGKYDFTVGSYYVTKPIEGYLVFRNDQGKLKFRFDPLAGKTKEPFAPLSDFTVNSKDFELTLTRDGKSRTYKTDDQFSKAEQACLNQAGKR